MTKTLKELHSMINNAYKNIDTARSNIDMGMSILWEVSYQLLSHIRENREAGEDD